MQMRSDQQKQILVGLNDKAKRIVDQLSPAECSALAGQKPRLMKRAISEEHERKLKSLGLVERKLGGLALTSVGELAATIASRRCLGL
jgi:hypothetical protein